ncbi:MAG: DUF1289 domain-containing protein [Pseudomonadota bacterium]
MQSPCIQLCSIDQQSGFCHGCGRTREEIGAWTLYTDQQREEIMAELVTRIDTIEKKPRRTTKRQRLASKNAQTTSAT